MNYSCVFFLRERARETSTYTVPTIANVTSNAPEAEATAASGESPRKPVFGGFSVLVVGIQPSAVY
jgi:hypothetical protein